MFWIELIWCKGHISDFREEKIDFWVLIEHRNSIYIFKSKFFSNLQKLCFGWEPLLISYSLNNIFQLYSFSSTFADSLQNVSVTILPFCGRAWWSMRTILKQKDSQLKMIELYFNWQRVNKFENLPNYWENKWVLQNGNSTIKTFKF